MFKVNNSESVNILARLKEETAKLHRQTESRMPFDDVKFSLPVYRHLLVNFYNFYRSFEPQIERSLERFSMRFDYRQRLKTPKLETDLANLKISFGSAANSGAENVTAEFDSAEKTFGALYVIEGSMLGGQFISRMLKRKFGLDETNGAAFFNGYGQSTGAMWNDFRAAITDFAETSDRHGEIIVSASRMFERIGQAIEMR